MNSSLIRKMAVLAAGMVPFAAWSLGLGEIQVSSKLNQPLEAEIALLYDDVTEPESTEVSLAAPEDFERVGLDASALLVDLTFSVQADAAGRYVIAVTSVEPVTDPFVDFLIEVNWPNGRLLREYVVLLDPPVSAGAAEVSSAAPQPRESAPRPTAMETPAPATADRVRPAPSTSSSSSAGSRAGTLAGGTYEVEGGDTLWEIARDYRSSGDITINQMMMALYRLNPDAFYQDNINALKKGAILRMPDSADLSSQSVAQALASVRTQNQAWESYRQNVSSSTPVVSESAATADYVRPTPAPAADPETRLELVPPSGSSDDASDTGSGQSGSDAANRAQLAELRDDLARSREDLISTNQENEEMRSRIADLERLISNYERTITLKDADLADLQNQIELTGQAVADLGTVADPMVDEAMGAVNSSVSGMDNAVDDSMADAGSSSDADDGASLDQELAALDQEAAAADSTAAEDAETSEAETPAPPPATSAPAEESMVDKALGLARNPMVLGGAGLLVLLGVGGLVLSRRGKGDDGDLGGVSLVDRIATGQEAETSELPVVETDDAVVELDTPSLDDLQAAAGEAPDSPQAHLAYLRALYAAEDKDRFVQASQAMLDGVGGTTHPAWMEVRAMGATLAPESGLFGEAEVAADEELDMPTVSLDEPNLEFDVAESGGDDDGGLDFDLDGVDDADDDLSLDIGAETLPAADADSSDDLDLGLDVAEPIAELADDDAGDDLDLDFDLDGEGLDLGEKPLADDTTASASAEEDTEFELQSVTDEVAEAAVAAGGAIDDTAEIDLGTVDDAGDTLAELESADEDLGDLGLDDLDLDSDELFGDDDSVGTKLDLAKAYIDMGDPEGAKGMLEEVMAEGSDSQKEEAQGLLDNLS
ncbi:MAG: FimV/HubP family polar landmark protein [Pseudomonadota bacterium]